MFSINDRKSFENLDNWLADVRQFAEKDIKLVLIGSKSDLREERVVTVQEARKYAKKNGIRTYIEVSAKSNTNVDVCFQELTEFIFDEKEIEKHEKMIEENAVKEVQQQSICTIS